MSSSRLVIIGGISGAGASTAIRAFADSGFFTVDNLPVPLLGDFLELTKASPKRYRLTAIMPDVKDPTMLGQLLSVISRLESPRPELIFLDATTEVLIKRYSETRRPHPIFDALKDHTVADAIQRERNFLIAFKEIANIVIDTTTLNVHEFRRKVEEYIGQVHHEHRIMRVNLMSFGFKYGTPLDCDLIVDVRFLPNPHFISDLRPKSGLEEEVRSYVLDKPEAKEFVSKYVDLVNFLLPKYTFEGKSYLNIGIGCTGGRHRSVTLAEEIAKKINSESITLSVQHRDIAR